MYSSRKTYVEIIEELSKLDLLTVTTVETDESAFRTTIEVLLDDHCLKWYRVTSEDRDESMSHACLMVVEYLKELEQLLRQ